MLKKIIKNLDMIILAIGVAIIFVILFLQVIFRYFLNSPIVWSEELARYTFVWITMIGISYNIRADNNISMTLLYGHCPQKLQKVLDIIILAIGLCLFIRLLPYSFEYFVSQMKIRSSAMGAPMALVAISVPIGTVLAILQLVVKVVFIIREFIRNKGDK